jgi:Icc-related predicted phosphoesterase
MQRKEKKGKLCVFASLREILGLITESSLMKTTTCFFVSDLHGHTERYQKLFNAIEQEQPYVLFMGGDLLPSGLLNFSSAGEVYRNFIQDVMYNGFTRLRERLGEQYPHVFLILGNDDGKFEETTILDLAAQGVWHYAHNRRIELEGFLVFGYSYVPPTPFALKDWERYDISRFVDPGCSSPEEGYYSVPVSGDEKRWATIQNDLEKLTQHEPLEKAIFLFHSPPYHTNLDRAGLDGKQFDAAPLDVHVGSIAIRRFIETRQPYLTLHGHVHESARITGSWKDQIGRTYCFSTAHDGKELALVRFDLEHPERAMRELI